MKNDMFAILQEGYFDISLKTRWKMALKNPLWWALAAMNINLIISYYI